MIFITAKFRVRPQDADRWPEISAEFTAATRDEAGCLWFDWSRSLDDPTEYVLVEAFRDGEAGVAHVTSDHFKRRSRPCRRTWQRRPGSSTRPSIRTTGPSSARWPSRTDRARLWWPPPETTTPYYRRHRAGSSFRWSGYELLTVVTNCFQLTEVKARRGDASPSLLSRTSKRPEIASVTSTQLPPLLLDRMLLRQVMLLVFWLLTSQFLSLADHEISRLTFAKRELVKVVEQLTVGLHLSRLVEIQARAVCSM